MSNKVLDVKTYVNDGFVKLCNVKLEYPNHRDWGDEWHYTEINEELMYSDHRSWVYFIVVDGVIYKVGETGQPLGIRTKYNNQPVRGTKSRFGRYKSHKDNYKDDTDEVIRVALKKEVADGKVSIWVKKCEVVHTKLKLAGKSAIVRTAYHKDLEKQYLNHIILNAGKLPKLNKGKA